MKLLPASCTMHIKGYACAVTQCLNLSPAEAANIQKYNRSVEYLKDRLKNTDTIHQVLSCASTDEVIHLYETAWHSNDTCDFYDEYEDLEKKYLIIKEEVIK